MAEEEEEKEEKEEKEEERGGVKGHRTLGLLPLGLWRRLRLAPVWRLVPWGGWGGGDSSLALILDTGGRTRGHTHGNTHAHDNTHDNTTCGWRCVGERTGWGWRGRQSSLVLRLDLRWEGL